MSGPRDGYEILGHPLNYWTELQKRIEMEGGFRATELLQEIADLRMKLSFCESRISEMMEILKK